MALIPNTRTDKIAFFNGHVAPWTTNAVAIGTASTAVTDLATKVTTAQTKLDAQVAAEQASKSATLAANDAIATMVDAGGDIIKAIRAKAAVGGNSVYELAQIPNPAMPTPVGTLGQPYKFKVELGEDGALTLKWKCASPRASGMTYQVWRSLSGGTDFAYVGGTGNKSFVDGTVPAGSARVLYKIQAVRSTAAGPWATFTVLFGAGAGSAGGPMTASVVPAKLAA